MNEELKKIKHHYGEKFAKLCRELFPTILEKNGLLSNIIMDIFSDNHFLYDDLVNSHNIENFKSYIYSFVDVENEILDTNKTPKELLNEAGYDLYECKSEKDIQSFRKYYKEGELLCTFNGGRLNRCFVFFAVKKNVDEIKRENFPKPTRQDEYGTSVISIQFYRGTNNTLSIKNRYNHTVNNPDATFSNNLDNIIPGLTEAFEKEYDLNVDSDTVNFELSGYIRANDRRYYKYNYEINNIYYCPDNIIIDNGNVKKLDKSRYILIDYFVLDLQDKKIICSKNIEDAFIDGFNNIIKIEILKDGENKIISATPPNNCEPIKIKIDKYSRIIEYKNNNLRVIGNNFLYNNSVLTKFYGERIKKIGDNFLLNNKKLIDFIGPNLISVASNFIYNNTILNYIYAPNLVTTGSNFLFHNEGLEELDLPNLKKVLNSFLRCNRVIEILNLPNLTEVGNKFLSINSELKSLYLPCLEKIGHDFMYFSHYLLEVDLPNLVEVGDRFLNADGILNKFDGPNLRKVGHDFMQLNTSLIVLNLPNFIKAGDNFLRYNKSLRVFRALKLTSIGNYFLYSVSPECIIETPNLTTEVDYEYRAKKYVKKRLSN